MGGKYKEEEKKIKSRTPKHFTKCLGVYYLLNEKNFKIKKLIFDKKKFGFKILV